MAGTLVTLAFAALSLHPAAALAQSRDSDGDGVPDSADAFPCDASRASVSFFPGASTSALLTFEDQWPEHTDLDFNDVAVRVSYRLERNAAGQVVSLHATFDPVALGGTLSNGLALQLPASRAGVTAVRRVDGVTQAVPVLASDALATLVLSDNLRELYGIPSGRINSEPGQPHVEGRRLELDVGFDPPAALSVAAAPFDVFIFRTGDFGHQIHFPQYWGTADMRTALFGAHHSRPDRPFVHTSGVPAALNLMTTTRYPLEGVAVSELFPDILGFASSAGAQNANFYAANVVPARGHDIPTRALPVLAEADRACIPRCGSGDDCSPDALCTNTAEAYTCACGSGFFGDGRSCTDLDECLLGTDDCGVNARCTNTPGGFTCGCEAGYTGDGRTCMDVNECETDNGGCGADGICVNYEGSYACYCGEGFQQLANGCVDIDECATNHGGCSASATCSNFPGGFACECLPGYIGNGVNCSDLDECATGQHSCAPEALCTNTVGSYGCACRSGYTGDGRTCLDIDECALGSAGCHALAACTNTAGSFTCTCPAGFAGSGQSCADVDECAAGLHDCAPHAVCTNSFGSFACACPSGFTGDGRTCDDVDECATGAAQCGAHATCENLPGTYDCVCDAGYSREGGACVPTDPGSLALFAGNNQTVARQRSTAPLVVRVLSPTSEPMPGYSVSFRITAGAGSLDPNATVTLRSAVSDAAGLAQVLYYAGTSAGSVTVLATTGVGHSQSFTITVRDYTPPSVTVTPLRFGVSTALEYPQVSPVTPAYLAPQATPQAANSPAAFTISPAASSVAAGSINTNLPTVTSQIGSFDNVASGDEPLDLRVTATFATGSHVARCAATADSVPGVAGRTCPDLTRTSPTQALSLIRRDLSPGQVRIAVTAADAVAGPLDRRITSLTASGPTVRQISNIYGQALNMGSVMVAPYGTNQIYLSAANANGRAKLYQYTISTNTIQQISDIRGPDLSDGVTAPIVVSGADVYFVATAPNTFAKLFKYDGISVRQVSDTRPDFADGVTAVVPYNGGVVFTANDAMGFRKLWWTNGQLAQQVSNTFPDGSDAITSIRVYNGAVYFNAAIATGILRLMRWNGSFAPGSVTQIDGPRTNRALTDNVANLLVYGSNLYMQMINANGATKLFRFNGSTLTQVANIRAAGSSEAPNPLLVWNSRLYFVATGAAGLSKLHVYDEATNSVTQISDTRPGAADGVSVTLQSALYPLHMAASSTRLFFVALNANGHSKLWQYNGATTTQVPETNPGDHESPAYLAVHGGALFYTAYNTSGLQKIFRYDGSTVTQLADLNPGDSESFLHPRSVGSHLVFWARDSLNVLKLWRTTGTSAPVRAPDTTVGSALNRGSDSASQPIVYNGALYFRANTALAVNKLHRYDGSSITQVGSTNLRGASDNLTLPTVCHGRLYFSALDTLGYTKLWQLDGSTVRQITDLNPVGNDAIVTPACFNDVLYFGASRQYNATVLSKLFSFDGTTLRQVSDIKGGTLTDAVSNLSVWSGALYFRAYAAGTTRTKLYRFDGTTMVQVSNICSDCSDAIALTFAGGDRLYLTAAPSSNGFVKLFSYDGTSFRQLTSFFPAGSDTVANFVYYNGRTYFSGSVDGLTKLYSTDGASLTQVSDLNPGSPDVPGLGVVYNGRLWLSAYGPNNRAKLFRFDGSTFVQMLDLMGEEQHDSPSALVVHGSALFMTVTNDGVSKLHRLCEPSAGCAP